METGLGEATMGVSVTRYEEPHMSTHATSQAEVNLARVQDIYGAFGRGDTAAILDVIADDCRWEHWFDHTAQRAGVSYLQARNGPVGVAEFFAAVSDLQIHDFEVLGYVAGEREVVAKIVIDASTPSGGRYRDEELHLWTLDENGKIVALRHYVDTAKHIAAADGTDTTLAGPRRP
jgi:ketosteroid isomerase-like protein